MKQIKHFITRLFRTRKTLIAQAEEQSSPMVEKVMTMIAQTNEVELTCDEVFELIDQFAEMAQRGENVAELMPLVQQHLDMCPDCREEYEALERVLMA